MRVFIGLQADDVLSVEFRFARKPVQHSSKRQNAFEIGNRQRIKFDADWEAPLRDLCAMRVAARDDYGDNVHHDQPEVIARLLDDFFN